MSTPTRKRTWPNATGKYDQCQTPPYALAPLLPHVSKDWLIWEPAAGNNGLLVRGLQKAGYTCYGTDILGGTLYDYRTFVSGLRWDASITNPPFSIKYQWLARSYELGKPFALLMPVETLGAAKAQRMFDQHGIHVMFLSRRVNFRMPNKAWEGKGAQFPTAWFCWNFPTLPNGAISFAEIPKLPAGVDVETWYPWLDSQSQPV